MILLTNAIEWEVRRKREKKREKSDYMTMMMSWLLPFILHFTFSDLKKKFRNTSENLLIYTKVYIRGSSYSTFSCNQNDNLIFFSTRQTMSFIFEGKRHFIAHKNILWCDVLNKFVRWILFILLNFYWKFLKLRVELKGMHLAVRELFMLMLLTYIFHLSCKFLRKEF